MKEAINEVKIKFKSNLLFWYIIKSQKLKVALVFVFIALVTLKISTTVLTFDWLMGLFT